MNLKVIGSGSSGNSYLLVADNGDILMIECGINAALIKQALDFNVNKVVGCLLTHEDGDHSKSVQQVMSWGIDLYATAGTWTRLNAGYSSRAKVIKAGFQFKLGPFTVVPFDVKHDVVEPVGFLIHHPECGKMVFITDTTYVPQTFRGLNNIIVEANFCEEIINEKMGWKSEKRFLRDRIIQSHFSLQNCKDFLKANDLSQVHNIVLIHLSNTNSDAKRFQREVSDLTGKTVTVASSGLTIPFNVTPY